jgi:hypothetical protein
MAVFGYTEFDALVRCARPHPDAEGQALTGGTDMDWSRFVRLALRHGITPLVARNAGAVFGDALPPDIAQALTVNQDGTRIRNTNSADELTRILTALEKSGIPAIPFKGPVLAATAYSHVSLRTFRDLDFLIRETDIPATQTCLAGLGYDTNENLSPARCRALFRYNGQTMLSRPGGEIVIEPHWTLAPAVLAVSFDYAGLWARARPMPFNGASILGFAPEDQLIVLSVHGSKEGWWRLQWICDIAWFMDANPALDWQTTLQRATDQGCLRMVLLAVSLANRLLTTPLPPPVAAAQERDVTAQRLADRIIAKLSLDDEPESPDGPAPLYRVSSYRLHMRERLRDRAAYVLRTILMPRGAHLHMIALPDALFALYYPVKLIHDYVLLPVWLVMRRIKPTHGQGAAATTRKKSTG